MQLKMTDKHKIMAFVLNTEFNYSQTSIAQLMKVSQSTISSALREVGYWQTIRNLSAELNAVRSELHQLGYTEPKLIEAVSFDVIE